MEDISSYINKICSAYTTRNYKIKDKIIAWNSKSDRVFRLNTSAAIENRIQKERQSNKSERERQNIYKSLKRYWVALK